MGSASFKKEDLQGLVDGSAAGGLEKISDTITGKSRWTVNYALVFRNTANGRFYEVGYSVGATESQDEGPFEYEPDLIPCHEVRPVEKVVTVYERVPEGA